MKNSSIPDVYSVNVYIHELESTLEPIYRFNNSGSSIISISLMYRSNDHYNSLILKGAEFQLKQ